MSFINRFVYKLVSWLFKFIFDVFFSVVEVVGSDKVPVDGPVIFVANHANQFMDGLAISVSSPRRVCFIAADKSMRRPIIGHFGAAIGAIPVVRPQDKATRGKGKVRVTGDGAQVEGDDSLFTEQLSPGCSLAIAGSKRPVKVKHVLSNTALELAAPVEWKNESEGDASGGDLKEFTVQPHLNHQTMFSEVWNRLKAGHCVGVFPEGGSHDRTQLLDLKPGVALMALGAMAAGSAPVTIVPVGLNYIKPNKFRSPVMIQYGEPWTIPDSMLQQYANQTTKRAAVSGVMDRVTELLRSVTLNVQSRESLTLLRAVRRMYQPSNVSLTAADYLALERRFAAALDKFADHPKVRALTAEILSYNAKLHTMHLKDAQVAALSTTVQGDGQKSKTGRKPAEVKTDSVLVLGRVLYTLLLLMLSLPSLLLNAPIALVTKLGSIRERRRALAKSSVKITGRDVIASYKVLIGLVVVPVLYLVYAISVIVYFQWSALLLPFVFVTLLYLSYLSISLFEELSGEYKVTLPLLLALFRGRYKQRLHELEQDRFRLVQFVRSLVEELGPKMDFWEKEGRIVSTSDLASESSASSKAIRAPLKPNFRQSQKPSRPLIDITGQKPLDGIDYEVNDDEQDLFN